MDSLFSESGSKQLPEQTFIVKAATSLHPTIVREKYTLRSHLLYSLCLMFLMRTKNKEERRE